MNFKTGLSPVAVLCTAASMGSWSIAHAQSGVWSDDELLEEVVVSASRTPTTLAMTPAAISVVNAATLERDKPRTMGDILNRFSGVYWNDLGNEQHSMGIRQPISTNSVYQYLEDGIPIRPLGVFNHNSMNELNMAGAEQVEVMKGPSSSLYGSNAVGGAVNLITAAPSKDPFASLAARTDAVSGYNRYDTAASGTIGDFGMRVSHYSARRDKNNWQEYSYGNKDSVTLRTDYRVSDLVQLRSTLTYSNLDSAMTGSVFENDYRLNPGKSLNTFTYRRDKAWRATFASDVKWTDQGTTTFTGFWRRNDHGQTPSYTITSCTNNAQNSVTCPTNTRGTINNNHVDSLGLDIKHVQQFGWLSSRAIAGVYLDSSKNPYVSDNIAITVDPLTGRYVSYLMANTAIPTGVRDYETKIFNYAPFFQYELTPIESLRVVAGGRYDSIKYDFTNFLTPGTNFGAPNESRRFSHFSPKLGVVYTFEVGLNVYANASEGFTVPDVSQLYGKSSIPDLKPATFRNYEIGARWSLFDNVLKLETALYRLLGTDTIVSFTKDTGDSINQNAGRTRSQGIEFSTQLNLKHVDARLAATAASHKYEQYRTRNTLDYSGKQMPQAPTLITAEVGVRPIKGLRLAIETIRQGAYWMNNANTVRYDGHTLINARGVYQVNKSWEVWAQGRNLGNTLYSDNSSSSYSGTGAYDPDRQNQYTPGTPRTALVGFTYIFGDK